MAARGGRNTILREENEELKEDQLTAEAQIKKLEQLKSAFQSALKRKQVSVGTLRSSVL